MKREVVKIKTKIAKKRLFGVLILSAILVLIPLLAIRGSTISELNQQISEKREDISSLDAKMESLEADIVAKQEKSATLKSQIEIIDAEIQKTTQEIEKTKTEIEITNLEIENVELQIQEKEQEVKKQKEILAEFIRVLHEYDQKNPVEILLAYDTLSSFMDQVEYLKLIENNQQLALDKLQDLKQELEWKKVELTSKKSELEDLEAKLEETKTRLDAEMYGRVRLLDLTQGQEVQYRNLLEKAEEEYQRVNAEIAAVQKEYQKKLEEARKKNILGGPIKGAVSLAWPVDPSGRITAYFMDPTYTEWFKRWNINVVHYGLDIKCLQGTLIAAAADAYVVKCRNAGYGYSYIMLAHNNEIATIYGHVSAFNVTEGQYVKQGDIIGLSGGARGTLGAGWLTTGSHLHFEVRVNGTPVDPMGYLP